MTDPEETMPFTHRPYGAKEPVDPATSPDGTASQPSGTGYVPPSAAPPPMTSVPYGPPTADPATAPGWGAAQGGTRHQGAHTAMVLGIVSMACVALSPMVCCVSLPGVFCGPFAWAAGVRARREIDARPGVYANREQATAGIVMGVIGTVLGILAIALIVLVAIIVGSVQLSMVG